MKLNENEIRQLVEEVITEIDWGSYKDQMQRLQGHASVGEAGAEEGKIFVVIDSNGIPTSAHARKDDATLESYAISDEQTRAAVDQELARVQAQSPNIPAERLRAAIIQRVGEKKGKVFPVPFDPAHQDALNR